MISLAELIGFIGKNLGVSRWIEVDQSMIDQFARCTGDHQWIHVDVDRAKSESPAGRTIAHGFLSLALVAPLGMEVGLAPRDASAVVNYGLDKVRFITPVKSGDRVRLQLSIESADRKVKGELRIKIRNTGEYHPKNSRNNNHPKELRHLLDDRYPSIEQKNRYS